MKHAICPRPRAAMSALDARPSLRRTSLRAACVALLGAALTAAADSKLTNLSVRSAAGSGAETLIVGFTIGGTGAKPVLLRGVGPGLIPFGVTGAVTDPQLALFSGAAQIGSNDDWGGSSTLATAFASVAAFALPSTSRDAALLRALQPGSYSAQLVAASGPGIALVECYDTERGTSTASFTNVSARSLAGTGANVLTVGFAISGNEPKPVLIRGIGPSLAAFGVTGTLPAVRLRLFDSAGIQIGGTTNWSSSVTPVSVFNSVGAFVLPPASNDGVLFLALPAGTYTAQVGGLATATGTALIEVYAVDNSPFPFFTLRPVVNAPGPAPLDPGAGKPSPGADRQPTVLTQTAPIYPFEARLARVGGEALIDFYVMSDGSVGGAVALRANDIRFATAAVAAVRTWTFSAGRKNGALVTTHFQVPIVFTLEE
jgi:TonB family protein